MKKITLIAIAALTASTALAAGPRVASQIAKPKAERAELVKTNLQRAAAMHTKATIAETHKSALKASAMADEPAETDSKVLYVPAASSFYSGMSIGSYTYRGYTLGFTGIRNLIGFNNLTTGTKDFEWTSGKVNGINEDRTGYTYEYTTSTETTYFMALDPYQKYMFPSLKATFGETEKEYQYIAPDNVNFYHAGESPADWGWDFTDEGATEITSWNEIMGVTVCSAGNGGTVFPEYDIIKPGATGYDAEYNDENGTPVNWYAYEADNIKIEGVATYIPPMPSAYQINAMWSWIEAETTEDTPLTVNVYCSDEKGNPVIDDLLGTGELTLPKGKSALSQTSNMQVVTLSAVDADGYEIDAPISVGQLQPVYVVIEGLTNPNLLSFTMVSNSSTQFSVVDEAISEYLYPTHAYAFISAKVTEEDVTEDINAVVPAPYSYYTDQAHTNLIYPSDHNMFFDVYFPIVMNVDKESEDFQTSYFTTLLPEEAGKVTLSVFASYDIDQLLSDDLMTAEASEDWLDFDVAFNEEESITEVTVWANSDNTTDATRVGQIDFAGYGCDFTIYVGQPAGAKGGIAEVAIAAGQGAAEYYDLQGRKLSAAPAQGVYIQRNGTTATKLVK